MKKTIIVLFIALGLFSCKENKQKTEDNNESSVLTLAEFDKKAGELAGKEVEVIGIVDHVCKHSGKKIFLVSDSSNLHIESETRFDDKLTGEEIIFKGIVEEMVIDEAYCQKLETDDIKAHGEGEDKEKVNEKRKAQAQEYRDEMKQKGVNELRFYSVIYISHRKPKI